MAKVFNNLLLEDDSRLLLESGDALLLEQYYYYEALVASYGGFALTGFDAILFKGRRMVLEVGNYVLTGQEILFNVFRKMAMSVGKLFAWGQNTYGQLGDNTTTNRHIPTQIGTSDWSAIASGNFHSLGILAEEAKTSSNFFLFFN